MTKKARLLPTSDSKLYKMAKCLGKVTFELFLHDSWKKHQCFHVNLLKEFQEPAQPTQKHLLICPATEQDEHEQWFPSGVSEPAAVDVSHLRPVLQGEIKALLDPKLFQETPGFTILVQST